MTTTRAVRDAERAVPRPLPGQRGLRRTLRRTQLLRGLRGRRADDPAPAHLVAHPFAPLEGADPLPGAPLPGRHLRRAGKRPLRPPARRRGLRRPGVRGRRARRHGCHRQPTARCWWPCPAARTGPRSWPPTIRSGSTAWSTSPPAVAPRRASAERAAFGLSRAGHRGWLGEVQPSLLAAGLPRLPRVLLQKGLDRAALHQADRGLRRLGPRHRPGDADRRPTPRGASSSKSSARSRRGSVPGARNPRRRGCRSAARPGGRFAEEIGGELVDPGGLRTLPARPRPGEGQPPAP